MLYLLNPRVVLAIVFVACCVTFGVYFNHKLNQAERRGYDRRAVEDKAAADAQAQRIVDLQRTAEKRYTVAAEVRDRFITQTITEVRHEAAPLASCPLPANVVRLLNTAAGCAENPSASSCSSQQVPSP